MLVAKIKPKPYKKSAKWIPIGMYLGHMEEKKKRNILLVKGNVWTD